MAAEAPIIKRVDLELGGNSPFVVLADADLDRAADAAVFGKFLHQGQICMSINRVIVEDAVHDAFVERFADRVRRLKVGDPDRPDTMVGPIINETQLKGLIGRIAAAHQEGARHLVAGEPQGLVLPPQVFVDVTNDMSLAREELFGPIAPVIRAHDDDDALRIANDTEYGLSAAVFTSDLGRGARFAERLQSGMAHVNDQPVADFANCPFGGEKNSGVGRFGGTWAVEAFTTDQWLTVQHGPRTYPRTADDVRLGWS
jgi:aldehyde dehydrogenase (NAD+)